MPSVKFDVDVSSFKNGISSAKSEVKTLDQQMKMIDATFKATGNSEQALAQKTQTLNSRMTAQKAIADQAKQALNAMTQKGIDPASESYQKMARELLSAQTGMMETQAALNDLSNGAVQAAGSADKLEKGLNGISKKISLDQVISGIGKITDGLESAAGKAVRLGESIWDNIMSSARWADDTATMAMMYGIDLDTFQRMQKLVTNGMDTSVDAILNSQSKLKKGIGEGNAEVEKWLVNFGLMIPSGKDAADMQMVTDDLTEMYFKLGNAIMGMGDVYEQEAAAQKLFGRSWKELVPLFKEYKSAEEFAVALEQVKGTLTEDKINAGASLNDKVSELEGNLKSLKDNVLLSVAPGLEKLASGLNTLLESLLEYLDTPEGQQMLDSMGESIGELFKGLSDISAEDAVKVFSDTLHSIVSGFEWISNNGETLLGVLEGIGVFWAGLKVSEGVLTLLKVITGLKDLTGLGGAATTAGAAAGGGWLTGVVNGAFGLATQKAAGAMELMNAGALAPVIDWVTHNTGLGQEYVLGTKAKGSTWEEIKHIFSKENWDNFLDSWNPNSENANVIAQFIGQMGLGYKALGKYWSDRFGEWNMMGDWTFGDEVTAEDAKNIINGGEPVKVEIAPVIPDDWNFGDEYTSEEIYAMLFGDKKPKTEIEPDVPEDTAGKISDEIGTVYVDIAPIVRKESWSTGGAGRFNYVKEAYANGIPYVPDTRLAWLHKGETVVPARQVAQNNRSFTSNTYFENVNINNGMDADGLAARVAEEQRRTANSFGG